MKTLPDKEALLIEWLDERVRYNDVPRLTDIMEYVQRENLGLKKSRVRLMLQKHPLFKMNLRQQRTPGRARTYRPIVVSDLGHWHADIGYFSINSRYETPKSYRAGFLIAKDILSRLVLATPLIKSKTTESLIKAFKILFTQYNNLFPGHVVKSIAFDRERAIMSHKFQKFLSEKGIQFHAFEMTSSKAKMAEGAIRLVREKMAILMRRQRKADRWWNLLPTVISNLNRQIVKIDGKSTGYTPLQINVDTVAKFKRKLHSLAPAYFHSQFDIAPSLVPFKYTKGMFVRAKLIVTSSETLGVKRSELSVTPDVFVIEDCIPYVTKHMKVGQAYRCRHLTTNQIEVFEENDIVPTSRDGID